MVCLYYFLSIGSGLDFKLLNIILFSIQNSSLISLGTISHTLCYFYSIIPKLEECNYLSWDTISNFLQTYYCVGNLPHASFLRDFTYFHNLSLFENNVLKFNFVISNCLQFVVSQIFNYSQINISIYSYYDIYFAEDYIVVNRIKHKLFDLSSNVQELSLESPFDL